MKKHTCQWERELAELESIIVMRTNFTGDPPYVGIEGLCLALNEALNERDVLRAEIERRKPEQLSDEEIRKLRGEYGVYS